MRRLLAVLLACALAAAGVLALAPGATAAAATITPMCASSTARWHCYGEVIHSAAGRAVHPEDASAIPGWTAP